MQYEFLMDFKTLVMNWIMSYTYSKKQKNKQKKERKWHY